MRGGKPQEGKCPVCHKTYTNDNPKTEHHILPKRFFKGEGDKQELCRKCHNKLETLIPFSPQLTEYEYKRILANFLAKHCCKRFRKCSFKGG